MPEAARLHDPIAHTSAMAGLITGAVAGVALAVAVIAIVGTGGLAAVAIGAGIAAAGAGGALGGEYIGQVIPTSPTGEVIANGAEGVVIGGSMLNAARAGADYAQCSGAITADGAALIAEGSASVLINGHMAARKGDHLVCGATIAAGCPSVLIGGPTALVPGLAVAKDVPDWLNTTLTVVMWVGTGIATGGAGLALGWGPALGGLAGGLAGGYVFGEVGGALGAAIGAATGNEELGRRIGQVGGGVVGGLLGGGVGARAGARAQSALQSTEALPPRVGTAVEEPAARPTEDMAPREDGMAPREERPNQNSQEGDPPLRDSGRTSSDQDSRLPGASDAEHAIDEHLRQSGSRVEANTQEGTEGAGRQGDRVVDGVLTEYKSLSGVADTSSDGLSGAFSNRVMNGRGQAGDIIVDVREQVGMTRDVAERGVRRAYGADAARPSTSRGPIQSIRVIGSDFDFTVPRRTSP